HWMDLATDDALLFAAKRLDADSVAILLAVRDGIDRTFDAPALEHHELARLGREAPALLLAGEEERAVAPEVAQRLSTATHGNPLALVELESARRAARHPAGGAPGAPGGPPGPPRRPRGLPSGARRFKTSGAPSSSPGGSRCRTRFQPDR